MSAPDCACVREYMHVHAGVREARRGQQIPCSWSGNFRSLKEQALFAAELFLEP